MRSFLPALIGFGMLAASGSAVAQSTPFLGQTMTVPFDFCPIGWTEMDGTLLQMGQNTALFSLLGTTYGGDGIATFALPKAKPKYDGAGRMLRQCIALQGIFPSH